MQSVCQIRNPLVLLTDFKAAQIEDEDIPNTDCNAVNSGAVAITPLSCWPVNHPLGLSQELLEEATKTGRKRTTDLVEKLDYYQLSKVC